MGKVVQVRTEKNPQTPLNEADFLGRDLTRALDQTGTSARILEITPDLAKAWLARNTNNRHPSPYTIERYARDMAAGDWRLTSHAISFSSGGRLLNGQNRLQACIRSGVAFQSLVIFGLDAATFRNEDGGRKRSRKDRLDIDGEERTHCLSAAIGWLHLYRIKGLGSSNRYSPTPAEEAEIMEKNPRLRDSAIIACRYDVRAFGGGLLAALHFLFSERSPEQADAFFTALGSGAMLHEDDPIYQLRKRLLANRTATRKLSRVELPAIIIKAWNYFREGKEIKVLTWRSNEPFPEIQ